MNRFGRSTSHHSALASATVLSVSAARRGSTSIETRPSRPSAGVVGRPHHVAGPAHVVRGDHPGGLVDGRRRAAPRSCDLRRSYVVAAFGERLGEDRRVAWSRRPRAARAAAGPARRWPAARRERSSSQTATPAAVSSASLSVIAVIAPSVAGRRALDLAGTGQRGARGRAPRGPR